MKVKDVIAILQNFDPDSIIGHIYTRDGSLGPYKEFELKFLAQAENAVTE
jgi:putative lipoic acid-binding regulatory protein